RRRLPDWDIFRYDRTGAAGVPVPADTTTPREALRVTYDGGEEDHEDGHQGRYQEGRPQEVRDQVLGEEVGPQEGRDEEGRPEEEGRAGQADRQADRPAQEDPRDQGRRLPRRQGRGQGAGV